MSLFRGADSKKNLKMAPEDGCSSVNLKSVGVLYECREWKMYGVSQEA